MASTSRDAARTREEILRAALDCFTQRGIAGTTLAHIRARSGASTGSIYHQFSGKDALAGELYAHALEQYQLSLLAMLSRCRTARAGITGIVRHYLGWTEEHPELARFLFEARRDQAIAVVEERIAALNRVLFARVLGWMAPFVRERQLRKLPMELWVAVILGPASEYARDWLAGRARTAMSEAQRVLAEAAWQAVAGEG